MSLALLRQRLAEILDVDRPASPGLATGIAALDGGLAAGGIPRGRLTEVRGALGSGRTTLVRRVAERAVAAGVQVAYVDATRTLAPRDWARLAREDGGGLWVVRPVDPACGAWCADVLLRSGAFGLVVLDGAPPLSRGVAVRLTRLARESDAALVVVGEERGGVGGGGGALVGGALRLRVEARPTPSRGERPTGEGGEGGDGGASWGGVSRRHDGGEVERHARWRERRQQRQRQWSERHRGDRRRFAVVVEKGGIHQTVEVSCAIAVARRLCAHPEIPDRRGVGRGGGGRGAERGARGGGSAAVGAPDGGGGRLTA
ncbi:MAG: hypothetical protein ACJ79S_08480 [Gemmatimonadaceae bacterium]